MKARHKRFVFVILAVVGVSVAASLVITGLRSNISYFYSPSQIKAGEAPIGQLIRVGGMVVEGSFRRMEEGLEARFMVTDNAAETEISYEGILPDLFKEGQGAVAKGKLNADGLFVAEEVLAKHDEKYLPPEVADTLKKSHAEGVSNMQEKAQ